MNGLIAYFAYKTHAKVTITLLPETLVATFAYKTPAELMEGYNLVMEGENLRTF